MSRGGTIGHKFNRIAHSNQRAATHMLKNEPMRSGGQVGMAFTNPPHSNIYTPLGRGPHHYIPAYARVTRA